MSPQLSSGPLGCLTAMNKYITLILLLTSTLFSQERNHVRFYGEVGFGVSNSQFPSDNSGINSNLSLSIGNINWLVSLTRRVNGVFSFTYPKDRLTSEALLLGKSYPIYRDFGSENERLTEGNVVFYLGISHVTNEGNITYIENGSSVTRYDVGESYGVPLELEFQYLMPKYRGVALNLFYNFNKFRNFYGVSLSGVFGIL